MLKKLRICLALLFWAGVTLLFLDVTGTIQAWLGWMAKLQFLPAVLAANVGVVVLLAVLTLLFGRVYCSVICPMGVMQDIISWISGKFRSKNDRKFGRFHYMNPKWIKVTRGLFLGVFVACLICGVGVVVVALSPYGSYGRIAGNLLRPMSVWVNNQLASWAEAHESYAFYTVQDWVHAAPGLIMAWASLIVVGLMAWFGGRLYCNSICPVGTVLGYLSRISLMRVHINKNKCKGCGLCERKCKAMAINAKAGTIDATRCVDCFDCLDSCKQDALKYGFVKSVKAEPTPTPAKQQEGGTSRRAFLATAVTMTAAVALKAEEKTVDGGYITLSDKKPYVRETPLCPPGALSLSNLRHKCVGCQLCISACPNQVLRPSTDLDTFMQPVMSFENGHCRPECHACSDVCPAGAILPLGKTHEEKMARKTSLKIGRAVFIQDNCIQVTDGVSCGNCARRCPSGAITMVPVNPDDKKSMKIPAIDDNRCIGCGACEHLCPSRPFAAIHVEGIEKQHEL